MRLGAGTFRQHADCTQLCEESSPSHDEEVAAGPFGAIAPIEWALSPTGHLCTK